MLALSLWLCVFNLNAIEVRQLVRRQGGGGRAQGKKEHSGIKEKQNRKG